MRHRKSFNHLGRKTAHRSAMLANMASSLILHKRIETTEAKAKALRSYVEPLITKSKDDTTHSRRTVFSYLQNKEAVTELFREVSVKVADRPGGYLRLLKVGARLGDNADMCIVELVDYNENMLTTKTADKAKPGRKRRGSKKKDSDGKELAAVEEKTKPEAKIEDAEIVPESEEAEVESEVEFENTAEATETEDKTDADEATGDDEESKEEK
jgi:large subunit ribosomal protein L17